MCDTIHNPNPTATVAAAVVAVAAADYVPSDHPFEKAGLGRAPFRFAGFERRFGPIHLDDGITTIGAPGQPMGTCDYCGTGIGNIVHVKSADGNRFIIGLDCAVKLTKGYSRRDPVTAAIRKAKNKLALEARHKREAAKLEEFVTWTEIERAWLEDTADPGTPDWLEEKRSLMDKIGWFRRNAGTAGNLKLYRQLLKAKAAADEPAAEPKVKIHRWNG